MNLWNQNGVPHKGWYCLGCYDTGGENGDGYETCQMCGRERIRHVHAMKHAEYSNELNVGCICAEKMSGDYVGPRKRENALKKKALVRFKWFKSMWGRSELGSEFLRISKHKVVIIKHPYLHDWEYSIDGVYSGVKFPTSDAAKVAAFEQFSNLLK